jgi:tetratricopeptide (TPR) repeat protein
MKNNKFILVFALSLISAQTSVFANWGWVDTQQVPIERLVSNLNTFEAALRQNQYIDRARVEFQIGRLYSMAYARKTEEAQVLTKDALRRSEPARVMSRLLARIAEIWKKQKAGKATGIVVEVELSWRQNLKSIKIHKSSGDQALDQDALAATEMAVREEKIRNAEESTDDATDQTYRIAFDDFSIDGNSIAQMPPELRPYYHQPWWQTQFSVEQTKEKTKLKPAQASLRQAITHLNKAIELDPSLIAARLGLAWCLDEAGEKDEAIPLYRQVFQSSYERDAHTKVGCFPQLLSIESGKYLLKLLDPQINGPEIADIKSKIIQVNARIPDCMTPLLVPLTSASKLEDLVQARQVSFNLDGQGARTCLSWITPEAGWLVFDKSGSGIVTSGKELIGGVTFWVFWKHGYEVLSALDDNHDGKLTAEEMDRLAIWNDANGDGVSQPGEVKPLSYWHIKELSCKATEENEHWLSSKGGVTLEDGTHRPSYDVWIEQEAPEKGHELVKKL